MSTSPTLLPVLSRGRHRSPRHGGCFMEFASLLAGERWSDHPRCTHRVLAAIARRVNDCTSDAGRSQLAPLIPAVIGTANDDPRISPRLVTLACRTALPYACGKERQVLAAALLTAQRFLAGEEGRDPDLEAGLAEPGLTPQEAAWAEAFLRDMRPPRRYYLRQGAKWAVECAVSIIAPSTDPATDTALRDLLAASIGLFSGVVDGPCGEPGDEHTGGGAPAPQDASVHR